MSVTAAEDITIALAPGDTVRVAEDAVSVDGRASLSVRGKLGRLDFLDSYSGWYVRSTDGTGLAYVATKYLTKVSEADILRGQVDALTAKLTTAVANRDAAQATLLAFQGKVSDTARIVVDESNNNDEDTELMNKLLEALNLEPLQREFEVTVSFNGSYTTSVLATDADAAREEIDYGSIAEYIIESNNILEILDDYETEVE